MSHETYLHDLYPEERQPRITDQSTLYALRKAIVGVQTAADAGSIEHTIQELVKIRASQINGCAYCLSMHYRDALKAGERPDRIATLSAWREADWYSPRERAALAWTEALTHLPDHGVSDALFHECRKVFSEQEMVDLTTAIIAINSWNRIAIGFSSRPDSFTLEDVISS